MVNEPNAFAPPMAVDTRHVGQTRFLPVYVLGTLLGVFSATVWKANIEFVLYRFGSDPTYYIAIYSIASILAVVVGSLGYDGICPPGARIPNIGLRLLGGFLLGCTPYFVASVCIAMVPPLAATIMSLPTAVVTPATITVGAMVAIIVERVARAVIHNVGTVARVR